MLLCLTSQWTILMVIACKGRVWFSMGIPQLIYFVMHASQHVAIPHVGRVCIMQPECVHLLRRHCTHVCSASTISAYDPLLM